MNFFDLDPLGAPKDAQYYFDVCVIGVAVRRSLGGEFEDIWDLRGILEPRPFVYHFFQDEEDSFEDGDKWDVMVYHHCVVEISDMLGVCFYETEASEEEFNDEEYQEPNDYWRF